VLLHIERFTDVNGNAFISIDQWVRNTGHASYARVDRGRVQRARAARDDISIEALHSLLTAIASHHHHIKLVGPCGVG